MTRALAVVGATGVRGGVTCSCAAGGGTAGRSGIAGVVGIGGCDALVGGAEACGTLDETAGTSGLPAATTFSVDLFAACAIGSTGVAGRTGTSTVRGLTGGGVVSARVVSVGRVAGLAVGQLLTPPAWTVLHQGQRTGCVLSLGVEGFKSAGAGLGAGFTTGAGALEGTGSGGFGVSGETAE